jgi:hypothetical protein
MFSISTDDLPRLHSYTDAQRHFNDTKPIRGKPDIRPLGDRSKQQHQITEGTDKRGHYYAAKYHYTECIKFYESGLVWIDCGVWYTQSTCRLIHHVWGGGSCWSSRGKLWVSVRGGGSYLLSKGGIGIEPSQDHDTPLTIHNATPVYLRTYNKVTTKRIRDHLKPMREYWAALAKMGAERVKMYSQEWKEIIERDNHNISILFTPEALTNTQLQADHYMLYGNPTVDRLYQRALLVNFVTEEELYIYTPLEPGEHHVNWVER